MAEPLATVAQLATHTQREFDTEPGTSAGQSKLAASAALALQVASGLVRAELRLPNLTAAVVPDDVLGVVLDVAARRLLNPDMLLSETVGPVSETRFAQSGGSGLLPEERAMLARSALGRSKVYSVPFG